MPIKARVDQVIEWLNLNGAERPELATLNFVAVYSAGHTYGPEAPEILAATIEIDRQIAELWEASERAGIEISLLKANDQWDGRSGSEYLR